MAMDYANLMNEKIRLETRLHALKALNTEMVKALEEISKGMGEYSQDPLGHARNTIMDMKGIAIKALIPKIGGE
jgi:hypothetical protein